MRRRFSSSSRSSGWSRRACAKPSRSSSGAIRPASPIRSRQRDDRARGAGALQGFRAAGIRTRGFPRTWKLSAGGGTRTLKLSRAPAPKAGVYSSFTTPARTRESSTRTHVSVLLVGHNVNVRSKRDLDLAIELLGHGLPAAEVARTTGIPRSTVRDWACGRGMSHPRDTDCSMHDFSVLNPTAYAYLLGIYLGDGCISRHPRGVWRLRVTLDASYPMIVAECAAAIGAVTGREPNVGTRKGERCVDVSSYWKHWPCYLPQHGAGPKHMRPIVLADWQRKIATLCVRPLLRGLIHSDGTRIVATERKGRSVRLAPRYGFSNRSEDILEIFRAACELAGVHATRAGRWQIAVYSKAAVARLDEFVGPKT